MRGLVKDTPVHAITSDPSGAWTICGTPLGRDNTGGPASWHAAMTVIEAEIESGFIIGT